MSRLIDADALVELCDKMAGLESGGVTEFVWKQFSATVNWQPTIDAVPVVRCKDCKYSDDYYNDGSCYCKHPEREMWHIGTNWNWYCADGERKEKE